MYVPFELRGIQQIGVDEADCLFSRFFLITKQPERGFKLWHLLFALVTTSLGLNLGLKADIVLVTIIVSDSGFM
jgi:hypothetical protein